MSKCYHSFLNKGPWTQNYIPKTIFLLSRKFVQCLNIVNPSWIIFNRCLPFAQAVVWSKSWPLWNCFESLYPEDASRCTLEQSSSSRASQCSTSKRPLGSFLYFRLGKPTAAPSEVELLCVRVKIPAEPRRYNNNPGERFVSCLPLSSLDVLWALLPHRAGW